MQRAAAGGSAILRKIQKTFFADRITMNVRLGELAGAEAAP
jgi:hypothetical protein